MSTVSITAQPTGRGTVIVDGHDLPCTLCGLDALAAATRPSEESR